MSRLSSHFRNQADDARVTRVWSTLDARFARAPRRRAVFWAALASSGCAGLLLFLYGTGSFLRTPHAEVVLSPAASPQLLALADGSRVEHAADTRIDVDLVTPAHVELTMRGGRAHFSVAHNPARAFLTHAEGYTVRVVGTEFSVSMASKSVEVEVVRGLVEVRRDLDNEVWRVAGGQTWRSGTSASVSPSAGVAATDHAEPLLRARAEERHASADAPPHPVAEPTPALAGGSSEPARAPATEPVPLPRAEGARATPVAGSKAVPSARAASATVLFERAHATRLAGQTADTARLLGELVRRFPSDPRAGLAAFELARIRLEAGDARGALSALEHAQSAGDAFREQVQARRVQALEGAGDLPACRAARTLFLRGFPRGAFAEVVRQRCP